MPKPATTYTLAALADRFELALHGDADHLIHTVGTLAASGKDAITFLANRGYREQLPATTAGAVILRDADLEDCPVNALVARDPYLAYARIATLFDTRATPAAGIHPSAQVHDAAQLGEGVSIGPNAVICAGATLGKRCAIGPGAVVSEDAVLGDDCRILANATLCDSVVLGRRVLVHPCAVIGADGFGIARGPEGWEKVPQLGSVRIGDDCEIGANSCIDRGAIGDTVLEEDVRIDNHVQIGHNCHIGAHTAMAAYTGLSGSTTIGKNCLFAGRTGTSGHLSIADGVTITAMTMVSKDIKTPGSVWGAGIPAQPMKDWYRALASLRRLGRSRKQ